MTLLQCLIAGLIEAMQILVGRTAHLCHGVITTKIDKLKKVAIIYLN
jgi:hypothetical protein